MVFAILSIIYNIKLINAVTNNYLFSSNFSFYFLQILKMKTYKIKYSLIIKLKIAYAQFLLYINYVSFFIRFLLRLLIRLTATACITCAMYIVE